MHERVPTDPFGVVGWVRDEPAGAVAVAAVALLCLLVAAVGAVALVAQTIGTWESLFYMERAFALLLPAVKALLAVSVGASAVAVFRRR